VYPFLLDFSKNHFELFDLPLGFALDAKRLAERYRALQAATHPDRLAVAADREQQVSRQASTQVNEAYRILKDPLARAKYLLGLHTGDPGTDSETSKDGAFLMEQMELRETLAEAGSRPNPRAAAATVLTQLAERSAALDKELAGLFADPSAANLSAAREIVRELQFLDRCRRDAEDLESIGLAWIDERE
jgi:molecular chaperone HscB